MDLQIPERVARRIEEHIQAKPSLSPLDVIEQGLDHLDRGSSVGDSDALECLKSFRGMAKGWTLEQMLNDRRDGLAGS